MNRNVKLAWLAIIMIAIFIAISATHEGPTTLWLALVSKLALIISGLCLGYLLSNHAKTQGKKSLPGLAEIKCPKCGGKDMEVIDASSDDMLARRSRCKRCAYTGRIFFS